MSTAVTPSPEMCSTPLELFDTDRRLDQDERDIAATVRKFVDTKLRPNIADWFESATLPRDLARQFGELGVLGMHLDGYGCAGTNAVSYGLACLELEAGDSGLRSFVSVQGSLSMYSIHRYGSEEQKQEWLPQLASGHAIGCFGLTEPDFGSNPGECEPAHAATARTGYSTARRCGSPTAILPMSPQSGRRPTRVYAVSSCRRPPRDSPPM
ncbi:acyl-CoA dehydrogenase, N-terminal domain protein [Mycobacteroides abscessus MAB_091912_2446]|uniref:Acyl-CoA dehydrogenase, N-terminal domain protein n=1 Tax=Mycobacteroides abscessus MAB_091912_2446 TaxID=1335414 RepID=A0A829MCI1_9MYCO|nr:acyl-CoA dehydrogenase, N-terminal domain protein [Mycobacteroides abscessus MAB_091912_2446]